MKGFDEALLLDADLNVAEGSGANFFFEKDDKLYTIPKGNILPGITGLAQINGIDMSDPLRLTKVDYQYVKLQSIWLDIKIILLTLIGKGLGDKIKKLD